MLPGERTDRLDIRIVLRIYSILIGLGGMIIAGLGPTWFGASALARIFGALLVAEGCWAATLSQVKDPVLRRRGLLWFVAGHLVILLALYSQRVAIWGSAREPAVEQALSFALVFGLALVLSGDIRFVGKTTRREFLRANLRTRYEQQIREAGAQEERNRLARDLHDSIKQQIFVIQTAAATAQARFENDRSGAAVALEQIRDSARDAMTEMEVMMDQLRSVPLENAGLIEALKKQCEALGHRTGSLVEFKLGDLPPGETLPPGSHQAILRVAQEALANIGRHARASNVTVSLDGLSERLELRIHDDGTGFDTRETQRGMGIANMRARAEEYGGRFDLLSSSGNGTTVRFSVPYVAAVSAGSFRQMLGQMILFCVIPGSLLPYTPSGQRSFMYGAWASALIWRITSYALNRRRERRLGKAAA